MAALLPDDWDLTYIDANFEKIPDEEYTYVLMSPSTAQVCDAYAQAVRFRLRGSRILLGGPHVTMCAEEASRYADVVFVGEGEELFHVFLQEDVYKRQGLFSCEELTDYLRFLIENRKTVAVMLMDLDFFYNIARRIGREESERVLERIGGMLGEEKALRAAHRLSLIHI